MPQPQWQAIRDRKLVDVASRIPPEWQIRPSDLPPASAPNVLSIPSSCGILTAKERRITEAYTARSLLDALSKRELSAVEVTSAFCKRAAITHQLTSCLTEPLFQTALARAKQLDDHLHRTGRPVGPLHGLPISVKDTFNISGYDSTVGIAALCENPATENVPVVEFLLSAGAIIHCKTNLPQTALAIDSVNNVYGRVLNPQNRQSWTAGGSSGGEGVLVKMRGSVLGIGTDVGGSVRILAMCNGIIGFKPSLGRIPAQGQATGSLPSARKIGLEAQVGVIARTWDDVDVFFRAIEAARLWEVDQDVVPGRWWTGIEPFEKKKKPIIGIIRRDGVTEPLPPVSRVINDVATKLKHKSIQIIDIHAPKFQKCQSLTNKHFSAAGNTHLLSLISSTSEPLIPWLSTRLKPKSPITLDAFRDLTAQRQQLQQDFLAYWKGPDGRDVDAIICPMAPHPVPGIDRWNTMSYTASFVLLDYPAVSLPVRDVTADDLKEEMDGMEVLGRWDRINRELWDEKTTDRDAYIGSPLGVQVVAPRLQERRLFDVCRVIEDALRGTEGKAKL